jgi:GNAT superfamily N-acetyltransferase
MIHIRATDELSEEARQAVCDELRRFNVENNGVFFAARELPANASRPLYGVARDQAGRLLGGLLGETQLAWLKVSIMAVIPDARRQGIGAQLLLAAEAEAVVRGCRYAYADTMEYQAPGFYQKLGYQMAGRLGDWDSHGHAKFFFSKRLGAMPLWPGARGKE